MTSVAAGTATDGRLIAITGGSDQTVRIWDALAGTPIGEPLTGHTNGVTSVAAGTATDGRLIAITGGSDQTVRIWDPAAGVLLSQYPSGHLDGVCAISATHDDGGRLVAVISGWNSLVSLWDVETCTPIGEPLPEARSVSAARAVDGSLITVTSEVSRLRVWDALGRMPEAHSPSRPTSSWNLTPVTQAGRARLTTPGMGDGRADTAESGDGQIIAVTAGQNNEIWVWDLLSTTTIGQPLVGHTDRLTSVAVAADSDGQLIAVSGSADKTVRVWDVLAGTPIGEPLTGHTKAVTSVALGQDVYGRLIAVSGASDGSVGLWDLSSPAPVGQFITGHDEGLHLVAVGSGVDGSPLAVIGNGANVCMWNASSGAAMSKHLTVQRQDEVGFLRSVVQDGTGRMIAVTSHQNATVIAWDLAEGRLLQEIRTGHDGILMSVTVARAASGRLVAITSDQANLRAWDLLSGQFLGEYAGHPMDFPAVFLIASRDHRLILFVSSSRGCTSFELLGV